MGRLNGVQTGPEMAGQVFCTLKVPGAVDTCVIESVHMVACSCIVLRLEKWLEVCWSWEAGSGSYPLLQLDFSLVDSANRRMAHTPTGCN